ncbi:MAG TPA: hypothetical protein VJV23_03690 [Candidatus Polarisedimenticolia bacterium]|nr:hypothetical protein [Candidatus Polarisedimenticolia bacterium]
MKRSATALLATLSCTFGGAAPPSGGPRILPSCPQFPELNGPGVLCEDFDTDRNGVPGIQWTRLPLPAGFSVTGDQGDDILGYTMDGGTAPAGTAAVTCLDDAGGFVGCAAPVAEENDWHLHSPFEGPGEGYDPLGLPGIGAPDGGKAHSGSRSMHMGRHLDPTSTLGDTIRLRQVSAFVLDSTGRPGLPGLNIGAESTLSFWHIISMPDNENFGQGLLGNSAFGGGQVQIGLIGPGSGSGRWHRLAPSRNTYDSISETVVSLCDFDPGDDVLPPKDETMCDRSPLWADLGDVHGTDAGCTVDTDGNDAFHRDCGAISGCVPGPGCTETGSVGAGVWARSTFDLSPYAGRTARLRWIGMTHGGWSFGTYRSALEPDPGQSAYQYFEADDGWWIDDIVVTDLRRAPGRLPSGAPEEP